MSKRELPEGVPSDNQRASFAASDERSGVHQDYAAPDMATPQFHAPQQSSENQRLADADDGYVEQSPRAEKPVSVSKSKAGHRPQKLAPVNFRLMLLMTLTAAILVTSILAVSSLQPGQPLCSTQPAWNQFNCRTG